MSVGREGASGGRPGFPSSELRGVVNALVDQNLVGLICLDRRGVIVESNTRAREVLGVDGGLRERNGRLSTHRPDDAAVLERLLQVALDGSTLPGAGTSAVLGAWPGQRPLTVHVNPVPPAPDGGSGVAVLVTIVDPWVTISVDPAQVGISLGLTPAESGVAALLAEGRMVKEIAEATAGLLRRSAGWSSGPWPRPGVAGRPSWSGWCFRPPGYRFLSRRSRSEGGAWPGLLARPPLFWGVHRGVAVFL